MFVRIFIEETIFAACILYLVEFGCFCDFSCTVEWTLCFSQELSSKWHLRISLKDWFLCGLLPGKRSERDTPWDICASCGTAGLLATWLANMSTAPAEGILFLLISRLQRIQNLTPVRLKDLYLIFEWMSKKLNVNWARNGWMRKFQSLFSAISLPIKTDFLMNDCAIGRVSNWLTDQLADWASNCLQDGYWITARQHEDLFGN